MSSDLRFVGDAHVRFAHGGKHLVEQRVWHGAYQHEFVTRRLPFEGVARGPHAGHAGYGANGVVQMFRRDSAHANS